MQHTCHVQQLADNDGQHGANGDGDEDEEGERGASTAGPVGATAGKGGHVSSDHATADNEDDSGHGPLVMVWFDTGAPAQMAVDQVSALANVSLSQHDTHAQFGVVAPLLWMVRQAEQSSPGMVWPTPWRRHTGGSGGSDDDIMWASSAEQWLGALPPSVHMQQPGPLGQAVEARIRAVITDGTIDMSYTSLCRCSAPLIALPWNMEQRVAVELPSAGGVNGGHNHNGNAVSGAAPTVGDEIRSSPFSDPTPGG